MIMKPKIVVSSLDMDRLEALLDALPAAQAQAQQALFEELSRAEVVEPEDMPPDIVTMNSRVRFVIDNAAEEFDLSLAYPKDMDGSADKLSIMTPVGNALLGLKVGDSIEWHRPDGATFEVAVRAIEWQPERAGELHR
ncbi:nucleoside diphosphate kinase regulator [Massilia dura]|uniref:Nucleoside diphosphate kinase regulator n=2 Tax=Pseudoduganella dura TaxID=321982 RepID=A0A6I3XHW6_9BURK|nr:nucleoside diphosphate kinase regulator [Pseudoduganella dura]